MFEIAFTEPPILDNDSRHGRIALGDTIEYFFSSLTYWNERNYKEQWLQAIQHVVNGAKKSALFTNLYDPLDIPNDPTVNVILGSWWVIYNAEDDLYFQEQILFSENFNGGFDLKSPFVHICERERFTEDGDKISEWKVSKTEVEDYLLTVVNQPDMA